MKVSRETIERMRRFHEGHISPESQCEQAQLITAIDECDKLLAEANKVLAFYERRENYGPIDYSESYIEKDAGKRARGIMSWIDDLLRGSKWERQP